MPIVPYRGVVPRIDSWVFVAPTAWLGLPAKPVRDLRPEESENIRAIAARYVKLKEQYGQEDWT